MPLQQTDLSHHPAAAQLMDPDIKNSFHAQAAIDLAGIRSSILVFLQDQRAAGDLATPIRDLHALRGRALAAGMTGFEELAALCERALQDVLIGPRSAGDAGARTALDLIAQMEAALLVNPLRDTGFFAEVSDLVDEEFEHLAHRHAPPAAIEETSFEIDDETLEIFRSEADELLRNIRDNLTVLGSDPANNEALWEIRRSAHTFKGAAGIVGLTSASAMAHRVEDLLDRLAEKRSSVDAWLVDLLSDAAECLDALSSGPGIDDPPTDPAEIYAGFERALSADAAAAQGNGSSRGVRGPSADDRDIKPPPAPIVRVSLDRLDEILKISRSLLINRSAVAERFAEFREAMPGQGAAHQELEKLEALFETQRQLSSEILDRLLQIRMVRFGTLATRLTRSVNVTCQEENKRAELLLENGDLEVDTQVIDALIEPLLHLLRNAIVHGIESAETRRLIGKYERGTIRVRIDSTVDMVTLRVSDDGRGISTAKLIEKAVTTGLLDAGSAQTISETDALGLIFERGLTTAENLNLNAGRGVGMSIVKQSVEGHGGTISIETESQRGTSFTITLPANPARAEKDTGKADPASSESAATPLVLVVDDSASIRRHTAKILEEGGFRYITANDGAEALELLLSGAWEPDLILSDVEMPQIDGWEFLEYVKTDANFGQIPVVMITSLDSDEYRQRAMGLGASDYLVKPFLAPDLARISVNICSRSLS